MLLNTLLSGSASAFIQKIPMMAICLSAALLFFAFCIGAKKGLRRVNLFGLSWTAIAVAFFLIKKFALKGTATTLKALIFDGVLAVGCVLGGLILYKFVAWLRRPKVRYVKKKGDKYFKDENGVEYDSEKEDFDDYEKYASTKMAVKKGTGAPNFFGRLLGGIVCMLNVSIVLFLAIAASMYVITGLKLDQKTFAEVFQKGWVVNLKKWSYRYAIDFAIIGIILKNANNGYSKGFIESLRSLFVKVGVLGAGVVAFYLPFSKFASASGVKFLYNTTNRFMELIEGLGIPKFAAPFTGRLVCGAVIYGLMLVALWLVNKILIKLADAVHGAAIFRVTDGVLSCVVYAVIGVVVCVTVLGVLYLSTCLSIFNFTPFMADSCLAEGFFNVCEQTIPKLLQTAKDTIKGFISGFKL